MKKLTTGLLLFLLALVPVRSTLAGEVLVFAAASLTDALQEVAQAYKPEAGEKLIFSFGASSVLARQIQEGARADVFLSADEEKMDDLQRGGLVREETRVSLLSNRLVIAVARENGFPLRTPAELKLARRVAIAEPTTVPAGIYARQHLEALGIWGEINIVPTENVRGVLLAVESGNVEAGIVYRTDAAMSQKVSVAYEFPPNSGIKISYCAAALREGRNPESARLFLRNLQTEASGRIFEKHGFILLNGKSSSRGANGVR